MDYAYEDQDLFDLKLLCLYAMRFWFICFGQNIYVVNLDNR